ncbi:MAG TPA: hypothetical protein VHE35_16715 [Kofleriaceae bacterium]|nr:hypothetical protein [Kofleriaceae bacterium]
MDHEARYRELVRELEAEFPRLRLVKKRDAWSQRLIHRVLVVVTFGGMRGYLRDYQTTIGRTIYLTDDWDDRDPRDRYCTLRHEAVHLRQFRRYSLPGMALLYVLLPLPFGISYFRARFEREAYEESIRAAAEVWGPGAPAEAGYRAHVIDQFVGPAYGWMWPFRRALERWYDGVLASLPAPSSPGAR